MEKIVIKKGAPLTLINVENTSTLAVRFMSAIEDRYRKDFGKETLNTRKDEDRLILSEMIAAMCATIARSVTKDDDKLPIPATVAYLFFQHVSTFAKGRIPAAHEVRKWLTWPSMKAEQGKEGEK